MTSNTFQNIFYQILRHFKHNKQQVENIQHIPLHTKYCQIRKFSLSWRIIISSKFQRKHIKMISGTEVE